MYNVCAKMPENVIKIKVTQIHHYYLTLNTAREIPYTNLIVYSLMIETYVIVSIYPNTIHFWGP